MGDPSKEQLPQTFNVRYLGCKRAKGLWGIRHTRKPVDELVAEAKSQLGPPAQFRVSSDGCSLANPTLDFPIATISYGVQDLVYTRVFAMILVRPKTPFECHGFVCENKQAARRLTYCLAAAFQEYSDAVRKTTSRVLRPDPALSLPKFAIDLRTPEELAADYKAQDSEA
ncbi:hypothetical protein AAG570_000494 [Ranatra chinensis]|uniref:PID domain-containing protein n=1 Tax=Ranatra chinensis TaxID=642074 RepID=A0ABD0ZKJ1_9HEMI